MMNARFSLFVFASLLVAANSTTLRGTALAATQEQAPQDTTHHRRLQEATCTLYKKCVTYLPTQEYPNGYHKDQWSCELSPEDSESMHAKMVDIVENDYFKESIANAVSGESTMTISEGLVDLNSPTMLIPHDASIKVDTIENTRRRLASGPSSSGTLKTLVIRVLDKSNKAPSLNNARLQNDVFDDAASLKTQAAACSHGALQIQPFTGRTPSNQYINNGVVDVKMSDYTMGKGEKGLDQAAMRAATAQLGNLDDDRFDLVLFCFPEGDPFLAFAYANSKYTFYNDKWCGFVGAQLHEVGHNLGLGHSGQPNEGAYGDITGVMGGVPGGDDIRMCYNPQKSYQLGWYNDQVQTINPLDGVGSRDFTLNGVVDYKRNKNALIVLRLQQDRLQTSMLLQQDFYLGFNRAIGANADTAEDANKVTIVRKDSGKPWEYAQSTKVASLSPGQTYVLANFNNDRNVEVKFVDIVNGEAKITVTDPNPQPPYQPGPCVPYKVEIKTDRYPLDTSWKLLNLRENAIVGEGYSYDKGEHVYTKDVCVEDGTTYEFQLKDSYGDGLCCGSGQGDYRVINDCNEVIVSGGNKAEGFKEKKITFTAKTCAKPNPPPSGSCETYTVEIKTDNFPEDNSWSINDASGSKILSVDTFEDKGTVYKKEVCLNRNSKYEFLMVDSFNDGLCCKHGNGYYKVKDSKGAVVIDSTKEEDAFSTRKKTINVGSGSGPQEPPKECKDKSGKFKLKQSNKKSRTCKYFNRKNKCEYMQESEGVPIWQLCPVSCNRCGDL